MDPVSIVIIAELGELPLEIRGSPEQDLIEILAPDRSKLTVL